MKFNDRISDLEQRVAKLDLTNTKIDWESLSQEEQRLFERIYSLKNKMDNEILSDQEMNEYIKLMDKAGQILWIRVMFMFKDTLFCNCDIDSDDHSMMEFVLISRLTWFLNEFKRHATKMREEDRLFEQYGDSEEFKKAWNQYEETLEDNTPLWSQESYNRDLTRMFKAVKNWKQSKGTKKTV